MIDAEFRSEEKFAKLSLAYEGADEKEKVHSCVKNITAKYDIKPETYTCQISHGKEVLVIEYHEDVEREAGDIFEEIMKALDIKECD
jgi:phosphoribosylamine-glycine ligase